MFASASAGSSPAADDGEVVLGVAVVERGLVLPHPRHRAAQVLDQHGAQRRRRRVGPGDDDVERLVRQPGRGSASASRRAAPAGTRRPASAATRRRAWGQPCRRSARPSARYAGDGRFARRRIPGEGRHERDDRRAVRRAEEREEGRQLVRRRRGVLPVGPQRLDRALPRVEEQPGVHAVERMEPEDELGDDAEVAAATAQPPEQLRPLRLARAHDRAVGEHDLAPRSGCRRPDPCERIR